MKANSRSAAKATRASIKSQEPSCEICILAGGLSTRMGSDKSRALLGGKTVLEHVRAAAEGTGLRVRIIRRDAVPRCGPLGGIYTALKKSRAECLLFLACDMPFVSPKLLKRMLKRWQSQEKPAYERSADSLSARTRNSGKQPEKLSALPIALFAVQKRSAGFPFLLRRDAALPIVRNQIQAREYSLQSLAKKLRAKIFRAPSRELANINTPAELKKAQALF